MDAAVCARARLACYAFRGTIVTGVRRSFAFDFAVAFENILDTRVVLLVSPISQ